MSYIFNSSNGTNISALPLSVTTTKYILQTVNAWTTIRTGQLAIQTLIKIQQQGLVPDTMYALDKETKK